MPIKGDLNGYSESLNSLLTYTPVQLLDTEIGNKLPSSWGIYRILFTLDNTTAYIGATENLANRIVHDILNATVTLKPDGSIKDCPHTFLRKHFKASWGDVYTKNTHEQRTNARNKLIEQIKAYIRSTYSVQVLSLPESENIFHIEHFIISMLKPKYNDRADISDIPVFNLPDEHK